MVLHLNNLWIYFCIAFAIMLITMLLMSAQSKFLFTKDVIVRKFNIMDLEFAATSQEIVNIIQGIYLLPVEKSKKALNALKNQLYLDFLFMPAVYGGIFLLCMKVADKMTSNIGENFFAALAWLQFVPLVLDICENIHLLGKVKPGAKASSSQTHKSFRTIVGFKWGISLLAMVCSVAALCYFWLAGRYSVNTLPFLLIVFIELALFVVVGRIVSNRLKKVVNE